MSECHDLLIEIGTEELPPLALEQLATSLQQSIQSGLNQAGFAHGASRNFATPRRLAVLIKQLAEAQPPQKIQRRGPAESSALDAQGKPTPAAEGFARTCGVSFEQLGRIETDKGRFLYCEIDQPGKTIQQCLLIIIEQALAALPIPKRMRWGGGNAEFVRPVHWIIVLYGNSLVPLRILGIQTSRETRGHRCHAPQNLYLESPADYENLLLQKGKVIADFTTRKTEIRKQIEQLAKQQNGQLNLEQSEGLLNEVTALVEWPVALTGSFDKKFLEVPQEVLVETMQTNQKYFPVYDQQGKLMPLFIAVSNLISRQPEQIRIGNERVIRPRLTDAAFFWAQDKKITLAARNEQLKTVVFQNKLGTLHEKTQRVRRLAKAIAEQLNSPTAPVMRAAELCKADLMSDIVGEFPKLQGIMGRYFALADGEEPGVAEAIQSHYQPRYAGDKLPASRTAQSVAIADKIDTLTGIFAIEQQPSGVKDPFGLRRAAIGVLRIMIDCRLNLDLHALIRLSADTFPANIRASAVIDAVFEYMLNRLPGEYESAGFTPQQIQSVLTLRPVRPLEFDKRLRAVKAFTQMPEAESLSAADKRIRNILKKTAETLPEKADPAVLTEPAEKQLHSLLEKLTEQIANNNRAHEYEKSLQQLTALKVPIDQFFEQVMVMAEDPQLRINRLALLANLRGLFLSIADISCLQN